jgi:hypothetical protein
VHLNVNLFRTYYSEAEAVFLFICSAQVDSIFCVRAQEKGYGTSHFIPPHAEIAAQKLLDLKASPTSAFRVPGLATEEFHFALHCVKCTHYFVRQTQNLALSPKLDFSSDSAVDELRMAARESGGRLCGRRNLAPGLIFLLIAIFYLL